MSESYQLYYFASCPFCIRARVQLWQLGIELPLKNIKRNPEFKRELIAGGGKKQVPCLRIEEIESQEGQKKRVRWLYESKDIVTYFKKKT